MRIILVFVAALSVGIVAFGQTVTAPVRVSADGIQKTGATSYQYRGHVQIEISGTTITADEADLVTVANGASELELRGNVHVTLPPSPK